MAQYEVTLRDYWRILRRRRGIVVFTAFLLGFFSFGIATLWKPQPLYSAKAKLQITQRQSLTGLYLQTIAYNTGDAIETQQKIMTSHPVLRRAADSLGALTSARTTADTGRVLADLSQRITTAQEGYTNIISLSATDPVPERARDLANTLALVYRDYDHEQKNQQAVRHREFVERQRDSARRALEEAEERVRAYREQSELISLESQASVNLQGITTSEREVQRLQGDLAAVSAMVREMEANESLSEQTLQGVSVRRVGETFMALSRQLNDLKLQRDALLVQFTPDHPNVRRVQVKITQLGKDLLGELRQRSTGLQRDLATERERLAKLRDQYNKLPSTGLQLGRLVREVTMRQEVVRVLEETYQQALIREADKVEEVQVLERAMTPSEPVNPHHPMQRAAMGVLLGLILGIVFAVVAETLDTSIGTIEDVQEYTGVQVVGIVPFIDTDDVRASLQRRGVDVSDERTVERKAQLVAYFDAQSVLAETYRTLRTNIEFVTVEKGAKCLMVTSSMHQEGKSTTIANLSMTMAQLGKRTLLMDCDLRKPSIARLFGLDKEPGVTEVIVGNQKWQDVVRTVTDIVTGGMGMEDILQTQGISNLHIIASGSVPPNPAELLNSRRMAEFIDELREAYDVILIDTPPVLHVTDAAILGKKLDGALMVYKAGDVARTSLKRSISLLTSVGVDLLGIVLNGIRADMSSDYQDLGYNAYYAYGSEVSTPERTVEQRVQDWSRRWKQRLGLGDESVPRHEQTWSRGEEEDHEDVDDERDWGEDEDEASPHPLRRIAAWGALVLVVGGGLWQGGALERLVPAVPEPTTPEPAAQEVTVVVDDVGSSQTETAAASAADRPPAPVPMDDAPATGLRERGGTSSIPDTEAQLAASPAATNPAATNPGVRVAAPDDGTGPRIVLTDRPYVVRIASYPPDSRWAQTTLTDLRERGEIAFFSPVEVRGDLYLRLLVGRWKNWDDAYGHARKLRSGGATEEYTILHLPYAIAGGDPDRWRDYDAEDGLIGAFASQAEAQVLLQRMGTRGATPP